VIVLLCLAANVGAGVLTYYAFRTGSPARITLPETFDGYSRLHSTQTQQLESTMRGMLSGSTSSDAFRSASVGAYTKDLGDQPQLIVLAFPTAALPGTTVADEFTNGAMASVADPTSYPAGAHGGEVRCGTAQVGALGGVMCAWSDAKTTGLIASGTFVSPPTLAHIENDFRDLVD
jgi:hypothetical protein